MARAATGSSNRSATSTAITSTSVLSATHMLPSSTSCGINGSVGTTNWGRNARKKYRRLDVQGFDDGAFEEGTTPALRQGLPDRERLILSQEEANAKIGEVSGPKVLDHLERDRRLRQHERQSEGGSEHMQHSADAGAEA